MGFGYDVDMFSFFIVFGSEFSMFGSVNVVYSIFNFNVRINVGYQGFYDVIVIFIYRFFKFVVDCQGDVIFVFKNVVQFYFRYFGMDCIKYVCCNLFV